jgi:hypothetical protein
MKKKLLFLLGCTLLLLVATAAPSLADANHYYQVNAYDEGAGLVDVSAKTSTPVDAVPVGADVRIQAAWITTSLGLANSVPDAILERLSVLDPKGNPVPACEVDESTCRGFWTPPFLWDGWNTPLGYLSPYNPNRSAGIWARMWLVPFVPLTRGTYTIFYTEVWTRAIADPMWDQPGSYPPVYPAIEWPTSVVTFKVVSKSR